jgi:hypothetical protein
MSTLFHRLPKPLLFTLLGGLGCAVGWLPGEIWLSALRPAVPAAAHGTNAEPVAAPLIVAKVTATVVPPQEFNVQLTTRLNREAAKTGDVQISLMWDNLNDLDLHCTDPNGEHLFFGHKKAASRGELDVDMNARPPFSRKPVENIYWPSNGAPDGKYTVEVVHYARRDTEDATPYFVGIKVSGQTFDFKGIISRNQRNQVHTFTLDAKKKQIEELARQRKERAAQLQQQMRVQARPRPPAAVMSWRATGVLGGWAALLAIGLATFIVVGQNLGLRRRWASPREAGLVLGCGLTAGLVSGAVSQHLFTLINSIFAELAAVSALVAQAGQMLGWTLLGSLLGAGLGFFIPNLPRLRAALAGAVGGLLGVLVFFLVLEWFSDAAARLAGAVILGAAIGLAVALVEKLAREAALIVHWHENERTVINLGAEPVILGSSPEAHLYLPKHKGFPPITAIVTFREGRVQMENKLSNSTHTLASGNKLQIGDLWIEIQTDTK